MCPATERYLTPYVNKYDEPIQLDHRLVLDITKNAREVLAIAKRGSKIIFPDIFSIYAALEQQLSQDQSC
jgi:hypothetical protein